MFTAWAGSDGGYAEVVWYPSALLLLVLTAILTWATPLNRLSLRATVALGSLIAYTGWSYLSISWADDRGIALTGANRVLTYLLVFAVVVGRRWSSERAAAYVGAWGLSVVVVGAITFAAKAYSGNPQSAFAGGRLTLPVDYANANAALFLLAAWPLLACAQSRVLAAVWRVLALATAGIAVELALLAQSKGGALATVATVTLIVLIARRRVRFLIPVVLVAAVAALFHRPLFDVYDRISVGDPAGPAMRSALAAMAGSGVLLLVVGAITVIVDRRLGRMGARTVRWFNTAAASVMAATLIGGAVVAIDRYGSPVSIASRSWHAFKYPAPTSSASSHFVTSAGNHRYDFWRVAARQLALSPLLGAGEENFEGDYLRRRNSSEEPLYPHSLEASLLGGTGLVGFLLFAVFIVSAVMICIGAARSQLPGRATVGLAATSMVAYWLAHGSVDWLWEFPALAAPTFAVIACVASADPDGSRRAISPRVRGLLVGGCAAALLGSLVALGPAWLAARDLSLGVQVWRADASRAYARLDDAARLNPLSDQPYVLAGTIAERRRDWPRAERYFSRAIARNGSNWYSHLELGIAYAMSGRRTVALSEIRTARDLDPREPIVGGVLADVRLGRAIPVGSLDKAMVERTDVSRGR